MENVEISAEAVITGYASALAEGAASDAPGEASEVPSAKEAEVAPAQEVAEVTAEVTAEEVEEVAATVVKKQRKKARAKARAKAAEEMMRMQEQAPIGIAVPVEAEALAPTSSGDRCQSTAFVRESWRVPRARNPLKIQEGVEC